MVEYDIYKNIQPKECLNNAWSKTNSHAPNILALVNLFNKVSQWVVTTILSEPDLAMRTKILDHFVQLALRLQEIHNFHGMMEIVCGLQNSSIERLVNTWKGLTKQTRADFEQFENVLLSNFSILRQSLDKAKPPCLPYILIYLSDLTFIENGNPDQLPNGLINFEKSQMIAKVIVQIQQYQQKPFMFYIVPQIQTFLDQFNTSRNGSHSHLLDDKEAWELSLKIEPRQRNRTSSHT